MPFVYIAQNNNNKLYIGVSKHPYFRLKEHNTTQDEDQYLQNLEILRLFFEKNIRHSQKPEKEKYKLKNGGEIKKNCWLKDIRKDYLPRYK